MRIITHEKGDEAKKALNFYKSQRITKGDLYACNDKLKAHKKFMIVLDFDHKGEEQGLMIEKDN